MIDKAILTYYLTLFNRAGLRLVMVWFSVIRTSKNMPYRNSALHQTTVRKSTVRKTFRTYLVLLVEQSLHYLLRDLWRRKSVDLLSKRQWNYFLSEKCKKCRAHIGLLINSRVDRACATVIVNSGLIPVKPNSLIIFSIHSLPAWSSALERAFRSKKFCSVFSKNFWQIWRLSSPNLRFLRSSVPKDMTI